MDFGALIVILFILFFISSFGNKNKKTGIFNKIKEQIEKEVKRTKQEAPSNKQNIWDTLDEKESVIEKNENNLDVNLNLNLEDNLNLNTITVNNKPYKKDISTGSPFATKQTESDKKQETQEPEKPKKPEKTKLSRFSKNSLKNGVIWSEILSKPISLK